MEVVSFGLLKDHILFPAMIEKEWTKFAKLGRNSGLCAAIVRTREWYGKYVDFDMVCSDVQSTLGSNSQVISQYMEIEKLKKDHKGEKTSLPLLNQLKHILKIERQKRWLSWLEDMTCCLIEDAMSRYVTEHGVKQNMIYLVTFPEFYFTDYNDTGRHVINGDIVDQYVQPFYKEVVDLFYKGGLPEAGRRRYHPKTKRLAELTGKQEGLMIFAGTVIWKPLTDAQIYFYNTAPVYCDGKLYALYDKKMVSDFDGVSGCKAKYRHPDGSGSSFTMQFNSSVLKRNNSPVIAWTVYGRTLKIALSICMDFYEDPIKESNVDIHVLLSAGIAYVSHLDCICSDTLFVQCESLIEQRGSCKRAWVIQNKKTKDTKWIDFDYEQATNNRQPGECGDKVMVYVPRSDTI